MDRATQKSLQIITDDPQMKAMRLVADMLIRNWDSTSLIGTSEFETLKNAIAKEERKKALEIFLQQLELAAHGQ